MPLSGTLRELPVIDLLSLLAEQKKSGALKVKNGKVVVVIYLEQGDIMSAAKSDVHFPRYLKESSTTGSHNIKKIERKMELVVQDIVTDILDWDKGSYTFYAKYALEPEFVLRNNIPTTRVIEEGKQLRENFKRIQQFVPSMDSLLVPNRNLESITDLPRKHKRILTLIDGTRTINQILNGVNLSKYVFLQMIESLYNNGLITIIPPRDKSQQTDNNHKPDAPVQTLPSDGPKAKPKPKKDKKITPEQIEKVLDVFEKRGPKVLFEQHNVNTIQMFIKECLLKGLDFTLMRILQLYFKNLDHENPDIRLRTIELITIVSRELFNSDKVMHLAETVSFLLVKLEDEPSFMVYSAIAKLLQEMERNFRAKDRMEYCVQISATFARHLGEKSPRKTPEKKLIASILSTMPHAKALEALVAALESPDIEDEAIGILLNMGERALTYLVDLLKEYEHKRARLKLIEVIEKSGVISQKYIIPALKDQRWYVRRNFALILGKVGNVVSVNALEPLLMDEYPQVREAALQSIAKIMGPNCEKTIIACIKDKDPKIHLQAIKILAKYGTERTVHALTVLMQTKYFEWKSGDDEVLAEICNTLGQIGHRDGVETLINIISDRKILKTSLLGLVPVNACNALAKIGDERALRPISKITKHKNKNVQLAASQAISRIKMIRASRAMDNKRR